MAITQLSVVSTQETPKVLGTKEPLPIILTTDEYAEQLGLTPSATLVFTTSPVVGNTLQWTITGRGSGIITFIHPASPRTPGIQCFINTGGTLLQWVTQVFFPVLREIPAFDDLIFSAAGPAATISIMGSEPMQMDITFLASGFSITSSFNSGQNLILKKDFYLRVKVAMTITQGLNNFIVNSPWYYFKPERLLNTGIVTQDISSIVDELIEKYDLWEPSFADITLVPDSVRKCIIKAQEYHAGAPLTPYYYNSAVFTAIKGGRQTHEISGSDLQPVLLQNQYQNRFYTNRKRVYTDRRLCDYLYFFNPGAGVGQTIRVKTVVYLSNGLEQEIIGSAIPSSLGNTVMAIPCGFNQMHGDTQPFAAAYSVEIISTGANGTSTIIEPVYFDLRPESDYASGLQYYNTFGFLESILLEGSVEAVLEWNRKSEYVDMQLEPTRDDHPELAYDVQQELQFETATVPLSKEAWSAALDIPLSKHHYFINIQGDKNLRYAVFLEKGKSDFSAWNPDGTGYTAIPLKLRFPVTKTNSVAYNILDI